jgi:hypothetical protein
LEFRSSIAKNTGQSDLKPNTYRRKEIPADDMAKLADLIAARSRLIRHINKLTDAELGELEGACLIVAANAVNEFERQRGRTVDQWAIQLLDWIPGRRQLLANEPKSRRGAGANAAHSQAAVDAHWRTVRPELAADLAGIVARLKALADAAARGEPVASRLSRSERVRWVAEFLVLASGPGPLPLGGKLL